MKKLLRVSALTMILLLVFCAAGCKKEAASAPQTGTQAPQQSEETTPSATEQTGEATDATEATTGESGETEGTAPSAPAVQEQPTETQETDVEFDETAGEWEDEDFWVDEIGVGPRITVKWETYEAMSEAEKTAYRACFTTDYAFEEWEQMAMMDYESIANEEMFMGMGSLNLKEIIASLIGEEL